MFIKKTKKPTQIFEFKKPEIHIENSVIFLLFSCYKSMANSLLNPHIYYEKSKLKGPLKGVNFPTKIYSEWINNTELLSCDENIIREIIFNHQNIIYIIACHISDKSSILHEWAHAVYFMDCSYNKLANDLFNNVPLNCQIAIKKELFIRNYQPNVYIDEFQAYLVETPLEFGKKWKDILIPFHLKLKQNLPKLSLLKINKTTI